MKESTNVSVHVNEHILKDNEGVRGNYALPITLAHAVACASSVRAAVGIPHGPSSRTGVLGHPLGGGGDRDDGRREGRTMWFSQTGLGAEQQRVAAGKAWRQTLLRATLGLCPVWAWAGGPQVLGAPRSEHLQTLLLSSAPEGGHRTERPCTEGVSRAAVHFCFLLPVSPLR